jgi:hypothetical protein
MAAGQSGRKRPTRAADGDTTHLLPRGVKGCSWPPNLPNAEAITDCRTTRTANISGESIGCIYDGGCRFTTWTLATCRASFATRLSTAASRQLRLEGSRSPPFGVLRHWPTRIFLKKPSHRNRCCRQRASRVFHPAPWMQHQSPVFDEREIVTAASGLIIGSINRESRIVAEQKGADGAVADEEYVARSISG